MEKEGKNTHFPLGVAKDPSPLTRTDTECVTDPPMTEEGGKTRMAVSIALFDGSGGMRGVPAPEMSLKSVSGDCFNRG